MFLLRHALGCRRYSDEGLPIWLDMGRRVMYGIPGNANRGFKVADDTSGPPIDPTTGPECRCQRASGGCERSWLAVFPSWQAHRFWRPRSVSTKRPPTPTSSSIGIPGAPNIWIAGGGSGHGFKMGPVVGEMVAAAVLGQSTPDSAFSLARFARGRRSDQKWT